MRTVTLGLAAVAAVGVAAAGVTLGGCHGHGVHGRPDPAAMEKRIASHVKETLDDLHATPAQREKILALEDRLVADGRKAHGEPGQVLREALAQWESPAPDVARMHALVDARIDALRALAHEAVDAAAEAHDVLTPAQRAELARKIRRHHGG